MTTHAPLRSRRTKAESVYHVQITGDRDAPTSPLVKIQGWRASAPVPGSARRAAQTLAQYPHSRRREEQHACEPKP
jgi:hypothetical protein